MPAGLALAVVQLALLSVPTPTPVARGHGQVWPLVLEAPPHHSTQAVIDPGSVDKRISAAAKELYQSALEMIRTERYELAVEALERAIAVQPDYYMARNDLGVAYMKLKKLYLAEEVFREAIKINGQPYLAHLNLGIVLNKQRKYEEAAGVLLKLKRSHRDLSQIHSALIEALMESHQWAAVSGELKEAMRAAGADLVDLNTKLSAVELRLSRYDSAAAAAREAIKIEPGYALAHFNLGVALLQSGSLDDSEAALRRAYQLQGAAMAGAQFLLGQLGVQKKDYAAAIGAFETYLRDLPDAPNAALVREAIQRLKQAVNK